MQLYRYLGLIREDEERDRRKGKATQDATAQSGRGEAAGRTRRSRRPLPPGRYTLVVPVIFYHGHKTWNAPRSFTDHFRYKRELVHERGVDGA